MSDKQEAVNIGVTLSTQLVAAALAMIAVVGTFAAFVIDKREVGTLYYLIAGGSFFLFVSSIYLGGKGIDKARKDGFDGNWNITSTKNAFNGQAICSLAGIILFTISVFLGKEKSNDISTKIETQQKEILKLEERDSLHRIEIMILNKRLDSIRLATMANKSASSSGADTLAQKTQ